MSTKKIVISFYRKSDDVKRIILGKNVFIYLFALYSISLVLFGHFLNPITLIAKNTQNEYNLKLVDDSINLKSIASVETPVEESYHFTETGSDIFAVRETTFENKEIDFSISFLLTKEKESSKLLSGRVSVQLLSDAGEVLSESELESFKFRSGRYTSAHFSKSSIIGEVRFVVVKVIHDTEEYTFLLKEL